MASVSEGLTRLHQLLMALKEVRDQLARGPRQVKIREQLVAGLRDELAGKEAELKQSRAAADKKNLELRSKETHLGDLQVKLNQAASNREYDIIKGQIAADQAAKSVLEDEIIEYLERVDQVQRDLVEVKGRISKAEKDVQEFLADFESKAMALREQETRIQTEITDAEKVIPATIADTYRRLVAAHGADALAEATNGVCSYCFVTLTPQTRVELNSGAIQFCSCGRLLFLPADK